jgi:UDP-N-acetylmuramate--alanine ligase
MHIYFSGIGGAGLSPLAMLAQDCGYQVSGSDAVDSLGIQVLKKRQIQVSIGQSYQEIAQVQASKPIDWIVVTSALKPDHPHFQFAQDHQIKISKRHDLINLILQQKNLRLIAVAGTHGKTTTTAMIVWLCKQLGLPVSYSIGSNISFGSAAQYQVGSDYFVYEADEFDQNFLHFQPFVSVVTNIDYDHSDTYPSRQDYHHSFAQFVNQTTTQVYMWEDDWPKISNLVKTTAKLYHPSKTDQIYQSYLNSIHLPGQHNRENGWLATSCVSYLSSTNWTEISRHLETFPGTHRRFEKLAKNVYSDYAHHPTEIAATIQMAREVISAQSIHLDSKRPELVVVYQPHQNIRQHQPEIQTGYAHCFDRADQVFWLPTYLSRENTDLPILSQDFLVGKIAEIQPLSPTAFQKMNSNLQIHLADLNQDLAYQLTEKLTQGAIVVFMGAGSVDAWARQFVSNQSPQDQGKGS